MVPMIHLLSGKINFNVSDSGMRGSEKICNGVESIIDITKIMYNIPTIIIEYVSARGKLRCGFFIKGKRDVAHSNPKKPKITTRVACKMFIRLNGGSGKKLLTSALSKHIPVMASIGKIVRIKRIY